MITFDRREEEITWHIFADILTRGDTYAGKHLTACVYIYIRQDRGYIYIYVFSFVHVTNCIYKRKSMDRVLTQMQSAERITPQRVNSVRAA